MNGEKPIVSVVMITYMHEQFIADAINGILIQEVDFQVELILADDCSPDGTEKIVKSFESHPNFLRVKYTKHSKNIGMMPNFIWALNQARGRYIALCEGDDYWTDPLKLQKQVDFLEGNEDFSLVAHDIMLLKDDNYISDKKNRTEFFLSDFFKGSCINTVSAVFRNNIHSIESIEHARVGDWALFILCAEKGRVGFISEEMAVYRIHDAGIFSGVEKKDEKIIEILESFKKVFPKYKDEFQKSIVSKSLYLNLYSVKLKSILSGKTPPIAVYLKFKHWLKSNFLNMIGRSIR
jgi:glycosyltransferase involved in cell wall biosynthesis